MLSPSPTTSNQNPNPMHLFFLLLLSALFAPSSLSAPNYDDCYQYKCGDGSYDIHYPFRLDNSPDYCGHPDFNLYCDPSIKTIFLSSIGENGEKVYQVNSISYTDHLLHVTDKNFIIGDQTCPQPSTNVSIDSSPFNYSIIDTNLTVYLNCTPQWSLSWSHGLRNIKCLGSENGYSSFYRLMDDPLPMGDGCASVVVVTINETSATDLKTDGETAFAAAVRGGFGLTWKGDKWCGKCEESKGICGNDPSSGEDACLCSNGTSANLICKPDRTGTSALNYKRIIIGSVVGVGFLLVFLSLALYLYKHRKVSNSIIFWKKDVNAKNIEAFLEEYGSLAPKRYSFSDVKKITKAFQERLGQGGFGTVFKGTVSDGYMVAVKILNDSKGDGEEFINEVASIGRTSHVNVVSLLGFCSEGSKRALIYDYMCNGSLEKLLYPEKPKTNLDWEKLYQIAIGIARGLEYLHRGCNTRIVHFDIKPHNILLDKDFCPKISDFGLAKLCLKKDSIISIAGARGTIGYIAPEVFSRNFGVVSSRSDVYSYGMMVLEIAGGRKNPNAVAENSSEVYFPHWIHEYLDQNDNLLAFGTTAESEETVRKMILVGLWCIQTMPQNRPSISRVIEMLEGSVSDLQVPPKPYLSSSPFGSLIDTSSIQDICWDD